MGIRFAAARAIAAASTWGLKNVFRRPAANFPGKIALYADPQLIADLRGRVGESVCVVGTNGKTTVTNLLADAFEAAGKSVTCNRTGANLDSGVSTALLHSKYADWGIFECDELWLAKILPHLQSRYVLLLNLFRDQLDRVGEIDHIQASIAGALQKSPGTTLVYNADDPLCQAIADRVSNAKVPFGLAQDLGLAQNIVADARMCQQCSTMLEYDWRQYGQLGSYFCPQCGFSRTQPEFFADDIHIGQDGATFQVHGPRLSASVHTQLAGAYMVYNLLAICTVAALADIPAADVQAAIDAFDPQNGRLQTYTINGHTVLLNLAKNPTGFNQNLKIVMQGEGPKAVAFYINDKEADGHDVSWLWDIDFQELADAPDLIAFAGGIRKNDMQVRLKYGGVPAELVDGAQDFMQKALAASPQAKLYVIANYTALPGVKAELDKLSAAAGADLSEQGANASANLDDRAAVAKAELDVSAAAASADLGVSAPATQSAPDNLATLTDPASSSTSTDPTDSTNPTNSTNESPATLTIAHMYPTLLNLYGDGGNVIVLTQRARQRGMNVQVISVNHGDKVDLSQVDIVFLGGGPDREQHLASQDLLAIADDLRAYVEDDGVLLAICGGFQIIGREWIMGDETVPGLGLVDLTTKRVQGGSYNRIVDNVALDSPLASHPVVGYENHAGRTYLGSNVQPFGRVCGSHGKGNNDTDKADGVLYKNVVGTYLHGPLLAKNPEVADALIQRALDRRAQREGRQSAPLAPLGDSMELAANRYMSHRLGVD